MEENKTSTDIGIKANSLNTEIWNKFNEFNPTNNIHSQLLGVSNVDPTVIKTIVDYKNLYKIRHNIIHLMICSKLNKKYGERSIESFEKQGYKFNGPYYHDVKKLTPDYLDIFDLNSVEMFEVTVSSSFDAKDAKLSKYSLLIHMLKESGYKVSYKTFFIYSKDPYMTRDELLLLGLDDVSVAAMADICERFNDLLSEIHETQDGFQLFLEYNNYIESKIDLDFPFEYAKETHKKLNNKCFHGDIPTFEKVNDEKITSFMNSMADIVDSIEDPMMTTDDFNEFAFLETMRERSNTFKFRSVMPLPFLSVTGDDSALRSTEADFRDCSNISAKMAESTDPVISHIGFGYRDHFNNLEKKDVILNDDFLCHISIPSEVRKKIALEGPGRKYYISINSTEHIEEQKKHNGMAISPDLDVSEISKILFLLSRKSAVSETGDTMKNMDNIRSMSGVGLSYVKFCQSVYREININAMRGDRRKNFVLKSTGFKGVFVLLFPGPKLRCGELVNLCWFKVLVDPVVAHEHELSDNRFFKRMNISSTVLHSDWLSADVHRLEHYVRCYDKILMAYMTYISMKSRPDLSNYKERHYVSSKKDTERSDLKNSDDLMDSLFIKSIDGVSIIHHTNNDDTNVLGMIISIYLENRRSTSKMIQNYRYLVMTSISIWPKYNDVFDKMSEAIRSPLQLYLLKKALSYRKNMMSWGPKGNASFGKVKVDPITGNMFDSFGGSIIKLPRICVEPQVNAEFHEILCEMYFTMLFNKNQDDPTHSSFQVLDKILEGENNFKEVKLQGNHLGYRDDMSDEDFAKLIISKPRSHQFSRLAIEIGAILHRKHQKDFHNFEVRQSALNPSLNKTIDEYATFKSSSVYESSIHRPATIRQNPRRKCIQGVISLLDQGVHKSYEIVERFKDEETHYQVFKKNQIGGVREILILPITVRIRINVLETLSRQICSFDNREILTHGKNKNETIKSILLNSKRLPGTRAQIHITMDKSKWGPSFVPIQFLYLFTQFQGELGPLFNFILDVLIRHQNKRCLLPDRLVKAWFVDDGNAKIHKNKNLQDVKNRFLATRDISMMNESNMGQGILHFTSSLLHLNMISFRNELYRIVCLRKNIDPNDHFDVLSSDDSYTSFCPEVTNNKNFPMMKLRLFMRCQRLSELLFNCRTSASKSSINPLIGEFNSLFVSGMSLVPATIKFALSSVHMPNTDSFHRMVKECYSSSRQIIENGGSLDLYLLSHLLNKDYCESIYHTHDSGVNSMRDYGIKWMPYHMGHYPIFDPCLMMMFGPEFWNYYIYMTKRFTMCDNELRLFNNSHKMLDGTLLDYMVELENSETNIGGLLRIEASTGPIHQLNRMRDLCGMTSEMINESMMGNPMILFNKPNNLEEVRFRVCQKLYVNGSREAVKMISPSIYYGRVSATVSAAAFHVMGDYEKRTYKECLTLMIIQQPQINLDEQIKFIYPRHSEYEFFFEKMNTKQESYYRSPYEVQTIQKLSLHKVSHKLSNPLNRIVSELWGNKITDSYEHHILMRDVKLLKIHFPWFKDTMEETLECFSGDSERKIKGMFTMFMKMSNLRDKSFKGVIYGPGSDDILGTFKNMTERNSTPSIVSRVEIQSSSYIGSRSKTSYDEINSMINYETARIITKLGSPSINKIPQSDLNYFFTDPQVHKKTKKRLFMICCSMDIIQNVEDWTGELNLISHYWQTKQKYYNGSYSGNYEIISFCGTSSMTLSFIDKTRKYTLRKHNVKNPDLMFGLLREICETLDIKQEDLLKKLEQGDYIIKDNKILNVGSGFMIEDSQIRPIVFQSKFSIRLNDDRLMMLDDLGRVTLSLDIGFVPTRFVPDVDDFPLFGISFKSLCSIGAFSQHFEEDYLFKKDVNDLISTLDVPKPKLKKETVERLRINWTDFQDEKEALDSDIKVEFDFEELMSLEVNMDFLVGDFESDLLEFVIESNFLNDLTIIPKIVQSRSIFERIKNLKYRLIASMFVSSRKMNRDTIVQIIKMLRQSKQVKYIYWSLLVCYEATMALNKNESPDDIVINMNKTFMRKFFDDCYDFDLDDVPS